jgi:hypothetical protein
MHHHQCLTGDCAKIQIVFEIANFLGKNFPKAAYFDRKRKKVERKTV